MVESWPQSRKLQVATKKSHEHQTPVRGSALARSKELCFLARRTLCNPACITNDGRWSMVDVILQVTIFQEEGDKRHHILRRLQDRICLFLKAPLQSHGSEQRPVIRPRRRAATNIHALDFNPRALPKMCQTELNKSFTCRHRWLTIVKECQPGMGFNQQIHPYTPARSGWFQPKYFSAAAKTCPNCDKKGEYDWNKTRIILDNKWDQGTMGNGYSMTDGYGRPLPGHFWAPYQSGYSFTSCGMTRASSRRGDPGCGCTVM